MVMVAYGDTVIIRMCITDQFSDETKMLAQAISFFVAGTETSSGTMAFTLYELCMHPHIQDKVRSEVMSCIKKHGGCTYEAVHDMKYLNQCISGKNLM